MIIIELEGKEYSMPENWNEVNLEMFEKLIKHFGILSEYKSQFLYAIELFSILTGADVEDLSKMTKGSFEVLSKQVSWASQDIPTTGVREWVIDGEEWMAIKDMDSLEMGEVVSLELTIANSKDYELLTNVLPILVRRVKKITKPNGEIKKVPERFDADNYQEIRELFRKNMMVGDVNELKSFF
jgi:hypothetical protein